MEIAVRERGNPSGPGGPSGFQATTEQRSSSREIACLSCGYAAVSRQLRFWVGQVLAGCIVTSSQCSGGCNTDAGFKLYSRQDVEFVRDIASFFSFAQRLSAIRIRFDRGCLVVRGGANKKEKKKPLVYCPSPKRSSYLMRRFVLGCPCASLSGLRAGPGVRQHVVVQLTYVMYVVFPLNGSQVGDDFFFGWPCGRAATLS